MIKPKPIVYECPSCNWKKHVAPQSDALSPNEFFDECPKCGNKSLLLRPANVFDSLLKILN